MSWDPQGDDRTYFHKALLRCLGEGEQGIDDLRSAITAADRRVHPTVDEVSPLIDELVDCSWAEKLPPDPQPASMPPAPFIERGWVITGTGTVILGLIDS